MNLTAEEKNQLSVLEVWLESHKRECLENPLMSLYDLKKAGVVGKILDYAEALLCVKAKETEA